MKIRPHLPSISAIDSNGRTIWIADAHRDDGKRFVVHADEKLTAFYEPELGTGVAVVNTIYWQKITMSKLRLTTER